MNYEPVAPGMECDLSETALEEAAPKLGPAFTYDLHVCIADIARARRLVRTMGADTQTHPFAPHINVLIDPEYNMREWSIHANGKALGSKGVT